jgi:acyl carrier protein
MIVDLQEEFDAVFTQARLREIGNLAELVELLQDAAG